jgi:hypothetical protein
LLRLSSLAVRQLPKPSNWRIRAIDRRQRGGGAHEVEGIKLANELYPTVKVGDKEYKIELVIADKQV